jgi:enoyl-CoA hydratase
VTVDLNIDGAVATLTVNRPHALNALNAEVLSALDQHVRTVDEDVSIRVAIVTGAGGKAFVAGADIKAMQGMAPETARAFSALGHQVFARMEASGTLFIAAVDGFCLGGGCELALACDWINASGKSTFGQPEVNLGLVPGFGGTIRLARKVGQARALQYCTTAEYVRGEEAHRVGLVNSLFETGEVLAKTQEQAQAIAAKGPLAVANCKRLIRAGLDLPQERGNAMEQQAFGLMFGTVDGQEGMTAFLEKRAAAFVGE